MIETISADCQAAARQTASKEKARLTIARKSRAIVSLAPWGEAYVRKYLTKRAFYDYTLSMSYTPPKYPAEIPTQTPITGDLPDRVDDLDWLYAARYNELKKELLAVMTELGVLPKGSYADVAARLAACINIANPAAGDVIIYSGGVWARLPKGADGQVLTLVSGLPAWATPAGGFDFRTGDILLSTNLNAPSGWSDISTTYDKYFIRIQKDTPLTTGGSDTHSHSLGETNLPSHSHGYGTIAAAAETAHTHGVGTIANADESAHTHAIGTLAVGSEAAHTHAAGTFAVGNEAAHTHGGTGLSTSDPGNHTHSIPNSEDVGGGSYASASPTSDSPMTSSGAGAHTHTIGGSTAAGSSHTHSFSGTSAAGSSHTHSLTGAPGAGSAHTHSISGSTAAGSSHTHTISGSTAAVGSGTSFSGDNVPVWLGVRCYQKD
jgi:hypothetical protein